MNDQELMERLRKREEKDKALEELNIEMEQMLKDFKEDTKGFKEKYGGNASRAWALMRYKKYCIERGIPYDEKGRQQTSNPTESTKTN